MASKKREQRYPQLQSVRLGQDYAWIYGAIERQPEGRAGAVRALLNEVLGKRGVADLDVLYMGRPETVAMLPPTRLTSGFEHLPAALEATRAKAEKRLGYEVDAADVLRTALWDGLRARGAKAPKKPVNIHVEIAERLDWTLAELAELLGITVRTVELARTRLRAVKQKSKTDGCSQRQ